MKKHTKNANKTANKNETKKPETKKPETKKPETKKPETKKKLTAQQRFVVFTANKLAEKLDPKLKAVKDFESAKKQIIKLAPKLKPTTKLPPVIWTALYKSPSIKLSFNPYELDTRKHPVLEVEEGTKIGGFISPPIVREIAPLKTPERHTVLQAKKRVAKH